MNDTHSEKAAKVVVVGGGLGGLVAACRLAVGGKKVLLIEGAARLGGRGGSDREEGFCFNLGPHALYRRGPARRILQSLGVEPRGRVAEGSGGVLLDGQRRHALPTGFVSLVSTSALSPGGKLEAARLLARIPRLDPDTALGQNTAQWIDGLAKHADVRALLHALVRVTTYCHAPTELAADAALQQLALALSGGVLYLDGGWQSVVDALGARAAALGVEVQSGRKVTKVTGRGVADGVDLADGTHVDAEAVVLAVPPEAAAQLLRDFAPPPFDLVPVRASCLDVGLRTLPRPEHRFALGLDVPSYFSVHSAYADLAPVGGALIHVARYLGPDDSGASVAELEGLLDTLQPGWREVLATRRFYPHLTVSHGMPRPGPGNRRPASTGLVPGVSLVGDWVGPRSMLLDAALTSAEAAADEILAAPPRRAVA